MSLINDIISKSAKKNVNLKEEEIKKVLTELDIMLTRAYSKYSSIKVASVLCFKNGDIVGGCNIENSSFSHTVCAERCAVFSSLSQGKDLSQVKAVFITSSEDSYFYPCGACRQVLKEFIPLSVPIIILKKNNSIFNERSEVYTLGELFPYPFNL